jgi:endonuclease/exonuclease/phosphatase family metal-dependent hydrolase
MLYLTISINDGGNWYLELLAYLMPVYLVTGLVVLLFLLFLRPPLPYWLLPLVALLLGMEPLRETFRIELSGQGKDPDFTVMSFNAALFNPYRPTTKESELERYDDLYDYLRSNEAPDILCIQEFFHAIREDQELTADSILRLGGYSYFYINPVYDKKYDGLVGTIIFSKLPALARGRIDLGDPHSPNGSWHDFRIADDTVRVFNVQLKSMSIRWRTWDEGSTLGNIRLNLRDIHNRLKWGHRVRTSQMRTLERILGESPHPVIICADLNALPYSSTYQRLKRRYHNAFEQRGSGFGFTYHHFPWFIRIDNQFYSKQLDITHYRTLRNISISDHYPIEAGYRLPGN